MNEGSQPEGRSCSEVWWYGTTNFTLFHFCSQEPPESTENKGSLILDCNAVTLLSEISVKGIVQHLGQ